MRHDTLFVQEMWDAYRAQAGCVYESLDTTNHTRQYRCGGETFDCSAVARCDDYGDNVTARLSDPCRVGCAE